MYARIQGGAANGGEISLDGPSTSNFWLGQKSWENSDLPFMAMRGAQQIIVDDQGNGYTPDGLSLEVARYGDGSENGLINFFKIENNESKAIGLDYDGVSSLFNPTYTSYRGTQEIPNGNGDLYVPEALTLRVSDYGDGSENGSISFNRIENNEVKSIWLDYNSLNSLFNPTYTSYRGTQEILDGNGNLYIPEALRLSVEDYGNGVETGVINLSKIENNVAKNIYLDYDALNNLVNPTSTSYRGTQEILDGNGNLFVPDALSFSVADYGNGVETGVISLSKIENNAAKNIYLDYDALNNLVYPTSAGYRGTQEILDGNGNLYVPDALSFSVADYGNGVETGVISLSKIENSEIKNIYLDYNALNNLVNPTSTSYQGTQEIPDGNGNLFVPDALRLSVEDYGNGIETGVISLSKIENNVAKNIYLDYDALNNLVNPTSYSLLGSNNNSLVTQQIEIDQNNNQESGLISVGAENGSFINLIGSSGNINISGSLSQSSDRRLKKNIKTLTSGLSIVNQLRGVRYNWKDESRTGNKIGFIAQEVEDVLPELVKTRENGFKGVNYAEMTAVLVEAVKELSKQIDELKNENAALKTEASKVQSLEERLSRIEALLTKPATVNDDQK